MAQKRIEKSDLINPDAILSIVKDLEKLEATQKNILEINKDLIKNSTFETPENVKEYEQAVASTEKAITTLNAAEKERLKLEKQLNESTDEAVKAKLRFQKATKAQRDELRDLIILEDKEAGTLLKLQASSRKLRRERQQLNLETDKGKKRLLEINKALDKNNQEIKENSDALKKQKLNVGNYKDSVKEALDETNGFGFSISNMGEQLLTFAKNPLAAASAGLTGLVSLYASSTSGAKDLRSATTRLSTTYGGFAEGLAKLVGADGRGGGLLDKLAKAIQLNLGGINAVIEGDIAVSATNALDELRVTIRDSERLAKQQLDTAEELRQIRDDDTLSLQERTAANAKLLDVINEREKQQLEVQNQVLINRRLLLSLDKENIDLQLAVKDAEFEIADIQEENEGFRSEALTNTNSLLRDQNTLLKEQEKIEDTKRKKEKGIDPIESNAFKDQKLASQKAREDELAELDRSAAEIGKKYDLQTAEYERSSDERKAIQQEEIESNIRTANQLIEGTANTLNQLSDKRIAALEDEQSENERAITTQERRAEQGLSNTLALEQQKAAELEQQREQEFKKQERRQKILSYLALFTEFAKENPNTAAGKALAQAALAETISQFAYDGTESVGDDNAMKWRNTGRDDYLVALNKGERVITTADNTRLGNISNQELVDIVEGHQQGRYVMANLNDDRIVGGLGYVAKTIKENQSSIDYDHLGNFITTQIENGFKRVTRHKSTRPRI